MNNVINGAILVVSVIAAHVTVQFVRKKDNKKQFNNKMRNAINNMYKEES